MQRCFEREDCDYTRSCVSFLETQTATCVSVHPSTRNPLDTDVEQQVSQNEATSNFDGGAPNRVQSQSTN